MIITCDFQIGKFAYQLMFLALKLLFLCKILRIKQYVSLTQHITSTKIRRFSLPQTLRSLSTVASTQSEVTLHPSEATIRHKLRPLV